MRRSGGASLLPPFGAGSPLRGGDHIQLHVVGREEELSPEVLRGPRSHRPGTGDVVREVSGVAEEGLVVVEQVGPAPEPADPLYRPQLVGDDVPFRPLHFRTGRALLLQVGPTRAEVERDRKSTRLNSSHDQISYAVFCLKKKKVDDSM